MRIFENGAVAKAAVGLRSRHCRECAGRSPNSMKLYTSSECAFFPSGAGSRYNPARIWKLYGTYARKGDSTN